MKKLLLTITAITFGMAGVFAQTMEVKPEQKNISVSGKMYTLDGKKLVPTSRGVDDVSEWYNYTESYKEGTLLGQDYSTYVNMIWPDTTAYVVYSDGVKAKVGFHVIGTTFDPKDTNFISTGEKVLTKFNPYKIDSIAYTQFYIRQLDKFDFGKGLEDVVDTLYIQYFDITGMDVKTYVLNNQVPKVTYYYGVPKEAGFSPKTLLHNAAIKIDTILLDKSLADSVVFDGANTRFFGRTIQIPVGVNSKSTNTTPITNNLTAFSMVFKPMRMTQLGDTLYASNGATWNKKFNSFGVRLAYLDQHDQLITTPYRINNFFTSNFQVRYGQTFSIFKSYIPGTIFGSSIFFPSWVHITTSNLSSKDLNNSGISGAVAYPNPSSLNSKIDVAFNLSATTEVSAIVTDMNGRTVKTIAPSVYPAGTAVMAVNTENLSKGMYMVVLESAAGKTTTKINVQ
jgi:Secretion system C-terminal sorting domain